MTAVATDAPLLADAAVVAQTRSVTERALLGAAEILGYSLLAAGVAAVVALLYRWYVREQVPCGLPALFGLSAVVPFLGTSQLLRSVMTPGAPQTPIDEAQALFNIAAFGVALLATRVGTSVGDRIGTDLTVATGERAVEAEVSRIVQAVGRVITVELPEEVEDIVGYDPVPDQTKETLAGKTFVFPRRLTVDELRDRLVTRLKADYAVGHVDVELTEDGGVDYLAVGSRAAGIGPTLPPETSAVAVRADPAFAASAGDLVQVWRTDPFERVLTAEMRGMVEDVVTLAVDASDTRKLDAETSYKLVTLPVETRPDREFASVLRAAEETMAAVTVAESSDLAGQPVGAIDVTVVAIRPAEGPVEPLPARDRLLAAGDALYLVATPEAIRKVELGARPSADAVADRSSTGTGAALDSDERVDATTPVAGESRDDPGPAAAESRAAERATTDAATDPAPGRAPPDESSDATDESESKPGTADPLADADAPGIEALEDDEADGAGDAPADEDVPGIEALDDDVGDSPDEDASEGDSPDDADEDGQSDGAATDEPTRDDLADLPGTDVDDLTGADVDAGPADENGDGAVGADAADSDGDDSDDGWSVAADQRRDADDS